MNDFENADYVKAAWAQWRTDHNRASECRTEEPCRSEEATKRSENSCDDVTGFAAGVLLGLFMCGGG